MKKIMMIAIVLFTSVSFAQKERTLKVNNETNLIDVVYYHDNGVVSQTGSFTLDGKLQGEWISYNKEGQKTALANYDNGKKEGKWLYWINGTIKEVDFNSNKIVSVNERVVKDIEL